MNARAPSTGKPNHIMIGVDRPDGSVRVYASRELPTDLGWGQREIRNHIIAWHIDADMTHVLIVDKPTWSEAYARVFEIWDNQDHPMHQLDTRTGKVTRVLDGPSHPGYALPEAASEGDSQ